MLAAEDGRPREGDRVMKIIRQAFIVGCVAASIVAAVGPALADGAVHPRCCGWFPTWFFGGYPPAPAYYAGPLSGATYEHYYGSYWGRPYWRQRRVHPVK